MFHNCVEIYIYLDIEPTLVEYFIEVKIQTL